LVDILLDEATERFAAISEDLGYPPPRPVRRPDDVRRQLDAARSELAPLSLPHELLHFWTSWDPTSFAVLTAAGGGLHTIEAATRRRRAMRQQGQAAILLPIGCTDHTELAVELDAAGHPGSRLYRIDPEGETSLIGAGVADLLDLYADWIDRHNQTGRIPGQELHVTPETLDRVLDDAVERYGSQHIAGNRGRWPRHWLLAEGFDEEWLAPRGTTHSVVEFDTARRISWPLAAVIQGTWKPRSSSRAGRSGVLTDDTGSVELLCPDGIPDAGQGPGDRCEIEVVGIPPADENPEPLPTAGLLIPEALPAQVEHMAGLLEEMQAAMDLLGTSVVATAVRPLG
jgi:hypothetical protein